MSAAEHEHAAGEHRAMSEQHEGRYDPSATDTREGRSGGARGGEPAWPVRTYNPTEGHHAEAERHAEHAAEHAAAGEALRQFEQAQCQGFPPETRASCPLMGTVASVEDIDGGVRLHVTAGVPSEAVLDHMRCHLAFARSRRYEGMPHCALYQRGLDVRAGANGTVEIVAGDRTTVDTLRARVRAHVAGGD